ncbi:2-methyl-6-phytyl-1,4-hydroquinone methyltransferase 2, chloroplastic-like [Trifolium pratense]|uniref:2-methyl-6-phytyl-1,4-hydroquinone methyltransferase 2, chloroplastic-like n=1 Tax=Trifolium pratense TaxID=57577 RepID=UPI001E6964A0|nr:2-methyl-6-phytyl-1,4-hydroquinone methyltransferase 2, chloroplastic-like [Trifolium pratense]
MSSSAYSRTHASLPLRSLTTLTAQGKRDMWMLFPKEDWYIEWFKKAGFKDVKLKRIGPKWYRGLRRQHRLIMGCSVTGVKPLSAWS